MSDASHDQTEPNADEQEAQSRRLFLRGLGKWSGAAVTAAVACTWVAMTPKTMAGGWINRRGGWINRGGGGWVNRRGGGGGGWINRW